MKKLKLAELNLGNAEVLSREELKKVLGGMGSGPGGGSGSPACGDGLQAYNCFTTWDDGTTTSAYNCALDPSHANLNVEQGYWHSEIYNWKQVQCS